MASPGNQHFASLIGTLSLPMVIELLQNNIQAWLLNYCNSSFQWNFVSYDSFSKFVSGMKRIPESVSGHLSYAHCMLAMHTRDTVCATVEDGLYLYFHFFVFFWINHFIKQLLL